MPTKEMRSTTGENVRVALTTGDVIIIGPEWREVPEIFQTEAYALRCISKDMVMSDELKTNKEVYTKLEEKSSKLDSIKEVVKGWIDNNEVAMFTRKGNGPPNAKEIGKALGINITNSERDEAWHALLEEGLAAPASVSKVVTYDEIESE